MAMINTPKPSSSSMTDTVKVLSFETWDSNTTTWNTETRTWNEMGSLMTDTSKPIGAATVDLFATPPTVATRTGFTGCTGMRFTVSDTITVSQLGRLYVAGNNQNHTINLWISTDTVTPIASVTLSSALTSDANNFKYDDITPVVLTTGNTYSIASNEAGAEAWKDLWAYGSDIQSIFTNKFAVYANSANTYPSLGVTASNIYNTCGMKYIVGLSPTMINTPKPG